VDLDDPQALRPVEAPASAGAQPPGLRQEILREAFLPQSRDRLE
jgi:hypothetical protein